MGLETPQNLNSPHPIKPLTSSNNNRIRVFLAHKSGNFDRRIPKTVKSTPGLSKLVERKTDFIDKACSEVTRDKTTLADQTEGRPNSVSQNMKTDAGTRFEMDLKKVLTDDPKQTLFQKQSISERLEMLRTLGYRQDKIIENKAFVAADRQRVEE